MPWHTRADFERLREWGFNLVRYQVYWEAIEPVEGQYNEQYLDATVERLKWIEEAGIDVFLDIHQDIYCKKYSGVGFPEWAARDDGIPFTLRQPWNLNYLEDAVIRAYKNFWESPGLRGKYLAMMKHLADRVGAFPNLIGIDIINEPFPAPAPDFEARLLSSFYEDVARMFKDNGIKIPLIFEGMMFTSAGLRTELTFRPPTGAIFSPHYYDPLCHEGSPYTPRAKWWMGKVMKGFVEDGCRFGTPVLVGEFGISPEVEGYLDFLGDYLDLLDRYQVSWTYYSYDKASHESFGVIDENGREKDHLTRLVRLYPQRIAGDNPVFATTQQAALGAADGRTFDLTYTANNASARTVLFIPKNLIGLRILVNDIPLEDLPAHGRLEIPISPAPGEKVHIHATWN